MHFTPIGPLMPDYDGPFYPYQAGGAFFSRANYGRPTPYLNPGQDPRVSCIVMVSDEDVAAFHYGTYGRNQPPSNAHVYNSVVPESEPTVLHEQSQIIDLTGEDDDEIEHYVHSSLEHGGSDPDDELHQEIHPGNDANQLQFAEYESDSDDSESDCEVEYPTPGGRHVTQSGERLTSGGKNLFSSELAPDDVESQHEDQHPATGGKLPLPASDSDIESITDCSEYNACPYPDPDYRVASKITKSERNSESFKSFKHATGGKFKKVDNFLGHEDRVHQRKLKVVETTERQQWDYEMHGVLAQDRRKWITDVQTAAAERAEAARAAAAKVAAEKKAAEAAAAKKVQDEVRKKYAGKRLPTNYREPSPSPEPEQASRPIHQASRLTRGNIQQEIENVRRAIAMSQKDLENLQALSESMGSAEVEISPTPHLLSQAGLLRASKLSNQRKKRVIVSEDEDDEYDDTPGNHPKNGASSGISSSFNSRKRGRATSGDDDYSDDDEFVPKKSRRGDSPFRPTVSDSKKRSRSDDDASDDEVHLPSPPKKLKTSKASTSHTKKSTASISGRPVGWTDIEHDSLEALVRNHRSDEQARNLKPLRDMTLWNHLAARLAREYQIIRGGGACKNYWNRYGRSRSGFDERGKVPGVKRDLVTSSQGPKKSSFTVKSRKPKQKSRKIIYDDEDESEVDVPSWNSHSKQLRKDDDDEEDPYTGVRQMNFAGVGGTVGGYDD